MSNLKIQTFFELSPDDYKRIAAARTLRQRVDILKSINYYNLSATKQDVKNWRLSRMVAIDYLLPDWTDYIRVLDDVMSDCHINGIIETIKHKLQSKSFELVNASGKVDESNVIELFEQEWFFKFMDYYIESLFYPFSMVQLGPLSEKNRFDELEIIPRENIVPQYHFIKKYAYISGHSADSGWYYNDPELKNYLIYMSGRIVSGCDKLNTNHLGMLDKAAYHALGKKHMLIYWWRYGEIYGLPFRHGQTDIHDVERRKNLENMFRDAGSNQYVVTDKEDIITLIESKGITGNNIFRELMEWSDDQISKAFIGNTSVTDQKSFVGSAEVGERLFEERNKSITRKYKYIVNNELIPRMEFYGLPVAGYTFRFKNEDRITYDQKLKAIDSLKDMFEFDEKQLSEIFGFTLTRKQFQDNVKTLEKNIKNNGVSSVMPAVAQLYDGLI